MGEHARPAVASLAVEFPTTVASLPFDPVGAENSSGYADQVFRATRSGPWRADRT
jgi:hypothetical protein